MGMNFKEFRFEVLKDLIDFFDERFGLLFLHLLSVQHTSNKIKL